MHHYVWPYSCFLKIIIYCVLCMMGMREVCVHLEARGQLCGFGSYYMGSKDQTQVAKLLWKASLPAEPFCQPLCSFIRYLAI